MHCKYRTNSLFLLLVLLTLFGPMPSISNAQDTESKDDPTYIIVYIRLQVEPSPCGNCYDSLSTKIKRIPGTKAVRMDIPKSIVQFQMHSSQLVNEVYLKRLVEESALVPIEVLFEKEEPAREEDDISF